MKKLIFLFALALLSFEGFSQNGFRIGLNGGIPAGDANTFSGWTSGLDLDYDWALSEKVSAGLSTGITSYFARSAYASYDYIPIVGSVDFGLSNKLYLGGDAGIAIGLNSGTSTNFLYRIQLRYQASSRIDFAVRWNSVSTNFQNNFVSISDVSDIGFSFGYRFY